MALKNLQKGLTISQTLGLGFGLICVLIFVSNVFSQWSNQRKSDALEDVVLAYEIQSDLLKLERDLVEAESGQRGYIFTGDDSFLEPYNAALRGIEKDLEKIDALIKDDGQRQRLEQLEVLIQDRLESMTAAIERARSVEADASRSTVLLRENRRLAELVKAAVLEMEDAENEILLDRQQIAQRARALDTGVTWGSTVLVIAVCILVLWATNQVIQRALSKAVSAAERIATGDLTQSIEANTSGSIGRVLTSIRDMTRSLNSLISQVSQSGIQVTTSATQIAASSRQLESSMTEQAAATSEITATAKAISTTAEELSQGMDQLSTVANDTAVIASDGQKSLIQMESTIRQLASSTDGIAAKLGLINEKANNINTVVTTITKVADQTNLLSLNAAIEAEKAGEYGAGFSVVAREIRRLADQTAVATLEIETMVQDMQSSVSTGVMEMDNFTQEINQGVHEVQGISQQIGSVIDQIQTLTPQFDRASQSMELQAQSAQEIRDAMEQLNDTSQQTINAVQESNQSIDLLNHVVQSLQGEISRFKVMAQSS